MGWRRGRRREDVRLRKSTVIRTQGNGSEKEIKIDI